MVGGGGVWAAAGELHLPLGHKQQCYASVTDRNRLNPQDRL